MSLYLLFLLTLSVYLEHVKYFKRYIYIYSYALRSLSNRKVQFSYHDYVDAWYKVLLHQNEEFTHS
jgi:hypothetical protein